MAGRELVYVALGQGGTRQTLWLNRQDVPDVLALRMKMQLAKPATMGRVDEEQIHVYRQEERDPEAR
eukprot:4258479-Amphidinium_carterae.1